MTTIKIVAGNNDTPEAYLFCGLLTRMYARWTVSHDIGVEAITRHCGEFTVKLSDDGKSFDTLSGHGGIHRYVDISPFDYLNRRHTSFCQVQIISGEKIETSDKNIISYIKSPYTLVKNHITGEETDDVYKYLDGGIFSQ